ncbi:MAG: hypothetical protein HY075_14645 [Deltaproteobacteria bacterium]|nr:hypothetical protein [Deltaproteobacteria bacterium]
MKAVLVFALLAAGFAAAGSQARAADPIVGTWSGLVDQYPVGTQPQYPATVTFTSSSSGTSAYSSLSCGGELSGGGSGGAYRFSEYISYGRATATSGGCINGSIDISVQGDTMSFRWSGSWNGVRYGASGTLHRVGGHRRAGWSPGSWVRGTSVANVLGTCFTTWTCQPSSPIMRAPESKVVSTRAQRTKGACAITNDPESCGVCISYEPAARCEYCVAPQDCDPSFMDCCSGR